ncbi:hypothetical protein CAPTEDRAFT_195174 [Capitella teleta]|uniref:Uncharacterized protein n=1 Tax=Capitella teleta TaxID=283909 RepID=R7U5U5_CAPTE|nr:hypothetical protein CAPTEDRAFT_195174 [Capitella teleta]|eukprot:ELU01745.1 hypothetical protein CAPTEDRAFT_195174 [Capitella teleta]
MSFFKKFSSKKSKAKELSPTDDNNKPRSAYSMTNSSDNGRQDQKSTVDADDEIDLPSSFGGGRKTRNMSISRSGRHKYRNKQRSSVLKDEVYSTTPNSTSTVQATNNSPSQSSSSSQAARGSEYLTKQLGLDSFAFAVPAEKISYENKQEDLGTLKITEQGYLNKKIQMKLSFKIITIIVNVPQLASFSSTNFNVPYSADE